MPHTEQSKIDALRDQIKSLSALRDRMVNLVRFADHREHCATRTRREDACTCGYLDALHGQSESHDLLCRMTAAGGKEPPPGPLSESEINALTQPPE